MSNIKDVAEKAGVAKSTVSNVFSGKKLVSDEIKEKVLQIAKELDYVPNFYASSLSLKDRKTHIIGVLFEHKENMEEQKFHADLIMSALNYAENREYSLFLSTYKDTKSLARNIKIGRTPIDGAILLNPDVNDEKLHTIRQNSVECVIIGRPSIDIYTSYVDTDNYNLTREITEKLLEVYDEVYLLNANEKLTISLDRKQGFFDCCKMNNVSDYEQRYIANLSGTIEDGYKVGRNLIKKDVAFITCNSMTAAGLYNAIKEKKLKVGKDVGVFALGKSQTKIDFSPKLSYAKQDYKLIGKKAVEMLLDKLEGKRVEKSILVKSNIKIRHSIRTSKEK